MSDEMKKLGGFQEAAEDLTALTGRTYSRQGVQQMWKRRDVNGFPDRKPWSINGKVRLLFDLAEVEAWYRVHKAPAKRRKPGRRASRTSRTRKPRLVYVSLYPGTPEELAREDSKPVRTEIIEWMEEDAPGPGKKSS